MIAARPWSRNRCAPSRNGCPGRFLRVHRNALVAVERIRALERGDAGAFRLTVEGSDEAVEVSRRHVPEVRRLLRGND